MEILNNSKSDYLTNFSKIHEIAKLVKKNGNNPIDAPLNIQLLDEIRNFTFYIILAATGIEGYVNDKGINIDKSTKKSKDFIFKEIEYFKSALKNVLKGHEEYEFYKNNLVKSCDFGIKEIELILLMKMEREKEGRRKKLYSNLPKTDINLPKPEEVKIEVKK
jgi:hypothetical protein